MERTCGRLDVPSRVCNGRGDFKSCPMTKRVYVADGAQANRESLLHGSRAGVHPDAGAIARMNAVLPPCIMRGQSVRNVIANNKDAFGTVKERTVYDYIAGGLFDAKRGDLPEACSRRPRKRKKETKTDAKCRVGRNCRMSLEHCRVNNIAEWTGLDTAIGRVGGKALFTMILPGGLMLMFLRDRKSSQTCTRIFDMPWELAGPELSRRLFSVILTDDGAAFSDPDMTENWRPSPEHNPTRLAWRGIKLFCCDAYCPSQKPHVEREHREERRALLHGVSFDTPTQDDVNLVASHVASHTRGVLDGKAPYDVFAEKFGEPGRKLLDAPGIVKIPAIVHARFLPKAHSGGGQREHCTIFQPGCAKKTPIRTDREGERTRIRTGGTINTSMPQHRNAKPAPSPAEQVRLPLQWCVYFRALRMAEHRRHRRLAARADDGDEPVPRKRAGEGLGAMRDGDAEVARLAQAGVCRLDGRRDDHLVRRRIDAAAVVGKDLHAERFEKADVRRVQRAVGARHRVAQLHEGRRERAHADAADSNQVPFRRRCAPLLHAPIISKRAIPRQAFRAHVRVPAREGEVGDFDLISPAGGGRTRHPPRPCLRRRHRPFHRSQSGRRRRLSPD